MRLSAVARMVKRYRRCSEWRHPFLSKPEVHVYLKLEPVRDPGRYIDPLGIATGREGVLHAPSLRVLSASERTKP